MEPIIVSREIIKPSKPTPDNLKTYKLSAMDQFTPNMYVPVLLAYSNTDHKPTTEISRKMRKSLSEILTNYYPLAGQLVDGGVSITCNDCGVPFSEARLDHNLIDILDKPESLDLLFHDEFQWKKSSDKAPLLDVSLNLFSCGGFAVGICFSHKFGDAYSISTFLNDWATVTRCASIITPPQLISANVLPPNERIAEFDPPRGDFVTRRFVFTPNKIASLKDIVVSGNSSSNPTRVEVVTALIFKCVSNKPTLLFQTVNLRNRMGNHLPDKSIGNIMWFFPVMITDRDGSRSGFDREVVHPGPKKSDNIGSLVVQMRDQLLNLSSYANKMDGNQWFSMISDASVRSKTGTGDDEIDTYKCSSWCGFPVYKVDFGWGEPFWVTPGFKCPFENNILLMDTKSGQGIEAYVALNHESMAALEADVEFLQFASPNPSFFEDEVNNLTTSSN